MNRRHEYWAVECEEQKGFIALKKVRRVEGRILNLSWPDNFQVECPYCKQLHSYIKQEITQLVSEQALSTVPLRRSRSQ